MGNVSTFFGVPALVGAGLWPVSTVIKIRISCCLERSND